MDNMISRQMAIDSIQYAGKIGKQTCIDILKRLPPTESYTIHSDGRLWVTVDDIDKVNAVVVDESKSKFCKQFYMDAQPEIVRCCDCKYFVSECHYCDYFQWNITCDNFCSKAERREVTT